MGDTDLGGELGDGVAAWTILARLLIHPLAIPFAAAAGSVSSTRGASFSCRSALAGCPGAYWLLVWVLRCCARVVDRVVVARGVG